MNMKKNTPITDAARTLLSPIANAPDAHALHELATSMMGIYTPGVIGEILSTVHELEPQHDWRIKTMLEVLETLSDADFVEIVADPAIATIGGYSLKDGKIDERTVAELDMKELMQGTVPPLFRKATPKSETDIAGLFAKAREDRAATPAGPIAVVLKPNGDHLVIVTSNHTTYLPGAVLSWLHLERLRPATITILQE